MAHDRNSLAVHCWLSLLVLAVFAADVAADDPGMPDKTKHWAWQAPVRTPLPTVRDKAWAKNAVDSFILARLEAAGLTPAPAARRETLLRRVTFDLIGLPPTPAEMDAFVNDSTPQAWEKVIDRLLAADQYGERWGRHWLDLARFAESNGYEFDEVRPNAWRYRDYVIRSFNDDKPYDRFVKEQIAADELFPDDPQTWVATGFNLLGPDMTDASDQKQRRQNTLNDITDTTGLVFLGLTLGCARCHDHKFEPIPQADYYRLQAFFSSADFRRDLPLAKKTDFAAHAKAVKEYAALIQPLQDALTKLDEPYRRRLHERKLTALADEAKAAHETPAAKRTAEQKRLVAQTARLLAVSAEEVIRSLSPQDREKRAEILKELKKYEAKRPPSMPVAMGMKETGLLPAKTFVLERGELTDPTDEVHPGFPTILLKDQRPTPARIVANLPGFSGRRSALSTWITQPDNSLTARVLVNRLWQHHFGRALVETPNDFGVRGAAPSHPELLDWLASEFVVQGWSIKKMHKLMLLSAAYRQSSKPTPIALQKDPGNRLLARMNRQRLEGEIIRDSLLAVSGRLHLKMGGPGVFPPLPPESLQGTKGWTASSDPRDHRRRSVYIFARRNLRFPFLEAFDLPDSNQSCPKRERSTTAPQALALLNSSSVVDAAQALAARLTADENSAPARLTLAFRLTLGRQPTESECTLANRFLEQSSLSELCRALFNLNEFVYVD